MHATASHMSNVSESEKHSLLSFAHEEKLLHKPIIYHIPKHEKDDRRRAAPQNQTPVQSPSNEPKTNKKL